MLPDTDMAAPVLLLYLAAYAVAAAGILLPLFPRAASDNRTRSAGRFLQILALTGIIPSLQVILDALGITENLPASWPLLTTLIFNILIIIGLWAVTTGWSSMARAFSPAAWFSDRFRRPFLLISALTAGLNIPAQAIAILKPENPYLKVAGILLLLLALLLVLDIFAATARIYRPKSGVGGSREALIIKAFLPLTILAGVLSIVLPYPFHLAAPPLSLLALFFLGITLYVHQSKASENPEMAQETLFNDAGMTPREREIALMLAEGLSYKELSEKLFISLSTIQTHVTRIYGKMNVRSKTELSRKISGN